MAADGSAKWEELPDLLTPANLAAVLQVCKRTVSKLARLGQIPPPVIKSGNVLRWRKEDVRVHLERRAMMR